MNNRQEQILEKIILDYIATGQPVGSSKLAKDFGLSSATIRNEMAVMEKEGFVCQPHTSAGRVPTEKAYQFYIGHSLKRVELSKSQKTKLENAFFESKENTHLRFKQLAKQMAALSVETVIVAFEYNDVFYTGISHLFSKPEFADQDMIVNLSSVLDDLNEAISNIYNTVGDDVEIFVGKNNPFGEQCSTIVTQYYLPGVKNEKALFGILGPMRMKYDYNVSLLEYCRDVINKK